MNQLESMISRLDQSMPVVESRDARYRGVSPLRYMADEIEGDLKLFNVNICRVAVNAVAERIRPKRIGASAGGRDLSERATALWLRANMDQVLQALFADAMALGSSYLVVWPDQYGVPSISVESARYMTHMVDPISGEVRCAVKRWFEKDHNGVVLNEHVVLYTADEIAHFERGDHHNWICTQTIGNGLGVVPVVPVVNFDRVGDVHGYSVIDDLGPLVDALSKILADMLVASESVARPKRWATGVELEDATVDGFTADGDDQVDDALEDQAVSPFAEGNSMWTVESPDARFGQLAGAELNGYKTAADLIIQQIMAVSGLPAHMMGVTTANPTSADAIRAAEASLTSRAESRIRILGLAVEQAVRLLVALDTGRRVSECEVSIRWASPAMISKAQETDAVTKLFSLGLLTSDEAREMIGVEGL